MKKLYSAYEIAAMNLPGLPTSKPAILARAEKEDWHYETKRGLGGIRKMFVIPKEYLPTSPDESKSSPGVAPRSNKTHANDEETTFDIPRKRDNVAGAISGGKEVDPKQLASAIRALDEWLIENNLKIDSPDKKAEIVAFLYKYLQKGAAHGDVHEILRLLMR